MTCLRFSAMLIILYLILCIKRCSAKMMNKCMLCREKNALINEAGQFMTTLRECVLSLVYCSVIRSCRKIMDTDPEYIVTLEGDGKYEEESFKSSCCRSGSHDR